MEARVKLYMPKEKTFPVPLKYIDVTRNTHTSRDAMMDKNIDDYLNVNGERALSDAWTCFTRFTSLNARPLDGYSWSGRETYEEANDLKTRQFMAKYVDFHVRYSKKESKTKMGYRETKAR